MFLTLPPLACNHIRSWYWKEKKMHLQLMQCFCISPLSSKYCLKQVLEKQILSFRKNKNKQNQKNPKQNKKPPQKSKKPNKAS